MRAVAETALEAGLRPVIVVTGAAAEIRRSRPRILAGQDRSERSLGETDKPPRSEQASQQLRHQPVRRLFLLVDQPQVTPDVLRALVEDARDGPARPSWRR